MYVCVEQDCHLFYFLSIKFRLCSYMFYIVLHACQNIYLYNNLAIFSVQGINVNVESKSGDTARSLALKYGHMNVKFLIDSYMQSKRKSKFLFHMLLIILYVIDLMSSTNCIKEILLFL